MSEDEGQNHDEGKNRLDLLPADVEWAVAEVLTWAIASGKYPARNWEKGMAYSKPWASAKRHMNKYQRGEDFDKESKCRTLAHAIFRLSQVLAYDLRGMSHLDDVRGKTYE